MDYLLEPIVEIFEDDEIIYLDDPYCDKCDLIFCSLSNLSTHNKDIHGINQKLMQPNDPYCDKCDIVFVAFDNLDRHNKVTHWEELNLDPPIGE